MDDTNQNFGHLFRSLREQAGRQLSDVAAELHINVAHLQALEDEAFDRLPSQSFARGYIRAYARALETDAEPLLKAYLRSAPPTEAWHVNQPLEEETQTSRLPLLLGTAAVAATIVALFVIWFLGSGYLDKESTLADRPVEAPASSVAPELLPMSEQQPQAAPVIADDQDDKAETAATGQGTGEDDAGADPAVADDADTQKEPTPEKSTQADDDQAEPTQQEDKAGGNQAASSRVKPDDDNPDLIRAPEGNDKVVITLNDDSWVDIKDANGQRLLRGLYLKGAHKTLIGQAPFQVFLGNAPAVTLQAAGKAVDLSGFVRPNKTARFVVLQKTEN